MKNLLSITYDFVKIMNHSSLECVEATYYHDKNILSDNDLKELLQIICSKMNADLGNVIRKHQKFGGNWSHII